MQRILQAQYPNCEGFNVAVQDGKAAGQSVSHVHVHILPRCMGDYERNDDVYNDLEEWAPRDTTLKQNSTALNVPDDNQRRDRTVDEMSEEAEQYRIIVDKLLSNTSSLH